MVQGVARVERTGLRWRLLRLSLTTMSRRRDPDDFQTRDAVLMLRLMRAARRPVQSG